ncbi:MAG: hypothetical protein R6U78_05205 [Bacteroidales bacterium]
MKNQLFILSVIITCWLTVPVNGQQTLLTPFRLSMPCGNTCIEYIDLDKDGDPDVLRSFISNDIAVQWIDDDDDMREGDLEGDMDSDCLMLDLNRDGEYGSGHDLIVDWNDEDRDGKADMQVVADNSGLDDRGRFRGHYIWIIDSDNDQVFNYVDWNTFELEGWDHAGHDTAYQLVFNRGQWDQCWMTYDEDDDCQRWERVEFYCPLDPFKSGVYNGGLDNNAQADVSGDRGEWDTDFSGGGKLYIGTFDGRIHLYGAEWGCWRIDQNATYYQGWQGWRGPNIQPEDHVTVEPEIFPTIKYTNQNNNGFMDHIHYDLDGDKHFERIVSLEKTGIPDVAPIIHTGGMDYADFRKLYDDMAFEQWENAQMALRVAEQCKLNTGWYTCLMHPMCRRDQYHYGYWLNFYIYRDLMKWAELKGDTGFLIKLDKAYYGRNWDLILTRTTP